MNSVTSSAPIQKTQRYIRSNLVAAIVSSIGLNLVLIGSSTWHVWNTSQGVQIVVERQEKLQNLSEQLVYLDEVLTMSANMLASTGQQAWEKRYEDHVPSIEKVSTELFENTPKSAQSARAELELSIQQLIGMETQSFQLVKQQKLTEAMLILQGEKYAAQKKIYTRNLKAIITSIETETKGKTQAQRQALNWSIVLTLGSLGLLAITGIGIVVAVRGYVKDRQLAQDALQASQQDLLAVNLSLEKEARQREDGEKTTRQENAQLQADIGQLLDVVNEIEAGNLTIQALVNDRATGLVSDTLNRLIEELGKTLRQVSVTAYRVDTNSKNQKEMAAIVASNTGKQTEAVDRVLGSTKKVRQFAQNTLEQLVFTNQSISALQTSVTAGQGTISSLDREIDVLQAGSNRIVQEIKTLGEFVGLADRFVQDQSEIVTQTQILALNASLVAARAAEQRDPKLFAAVAREFELIATQVSQLAQQTNEGLTSLEQRSFQIHRVVSSVDLDVQKLGGLVDTFTHGVKQTNDLFATVQEVTQQLVRSGNLVAIASEKIVNAADTTTVEIESISALSQHISEQSQAAQSLGDRLNILSTDLLANIQIFQLPAVELSTGEVTASVALEYAL
jgi:methyl-accepting chemotaxis protein PixJ